MLAAFARSIDTALRSTNACNRIVKNEPIRFSDGRSISAEFKYVKSLPSFRTRPIFEHAFQARIGASSKDAYGVGFADQATSAMQSAIGEAVERFCFGQTKLTAPEMQTSNGWAAHVTETLAMESAVSELVERDAVLVHWLSKTPFEKISIDLAPSWIRRLADALRTQTKFKHIRILKTTLGAADVVAVLLLDENKKFAIGTATGSTLCRAVRKAAVEALQVALASESEILRSETPSLLDQSSNQTPPPLAHGLVYARHLSLPDWMIGASVSWSHVERCWRAPKTAEICLRYQVKFRKIALEPFVVGYAQSDELQDLFLGSTLNACDKHWVNFKRLDRLGLGMLNYEQPHPIA
jgi:hypothetical protein